VVGRLRGAALAHPEPDPSRPEIGVKVAKPEAPQHVIGMVQDSLLIGKSRM
jgi:hypothetical protein